ncbi:MAG: excinuclease ABC subunit UvrC [Rickettsiales bacterium]|jgi:excinuclease ABC subunit C|nr:excinuclease ABC subunit UvrC [Rickettsiales bacterium]
MNKSLIKHNLNDDTENPIGVKVVCNFQANAPTTSGIYKMIDKNDVVLYVGKAKNLKNRLKNYTDLSGVSARIASMILQVSRVEIIETKTEYLALLMESNLIKSLRPKYNILLKDDKSYPYITISKDAIPRLQKFRLAGVDLKNRNKNAKHFFGPYASIGDISDAVKTIQKAFGIRVCTDAEMNNRIRPCILHQIGRCMAPCMMKSDDFDGACDAVEYSRAVQNGINFLSGKSRDLIDEMKQTMQSHSDKMEYEQACFLRDKIEMLSSLQQGKNIHNLTDERVDVIGVIRIGDAFVVRIVFLRFGSVVGSYNFFPTHTDDANLEDVLVAFMGQFYALRDGVDLPKEIWIGDLFGADAKKIDGEFFMEIENAFGFRVVMQKRGAKKLVVDDVVEQATKALESHRIESFKNSEFLDALAATFLLPQKINRVDVFDNSHLFGTNKVGAMIVFNRANGFDKKLYRKYNIESQVDGDDYAMMREVLERRYTRAVAENTLPDLVIVDGGRGQLFVANEVMRKLKISADIVPVVAIAKAENRRESDETFFMQGREATKIIDKSLLFFVERLRDESHRFVINTHRKKRANNMFVSELDDIDGIGAVKKKALLLHFGSVKNIINKTESEIAKVDGIDDALAKRIYQHFH